MASSSSLLDILQKAAQSSSYLKFDDLEVGAKYVIEFFEYGNTAFGPRVAVYIQGEKLFLPARFNKLLAARIDELNRHRYAMYYRGKDAANRNRLVLDFALDQEAAGGVIN